MTERMTDKARVSVAVILRQFLLHHGAPEEEHTALTQLLDECYRARRAEPEGVPEIERLKRGIEGAKDWAARSGASGLEQWCSEALNPTGKLAVFPIPEAHPEIEHLRAQAEIERLKAELARLTPSGQVAEDLAAVRRGLTVRLFADSDAARQSIAEDAATRLAAQAQGYEAMKAERDALQAEKE